MACVPPDQEVDDFAVAQRTPLPEFIAGLEGDEVSSRVRFHTLQPPLNSPAALERYNIIVPRAASPCVSPNALLQDYDLYAHHKTFGITILVPKVFLNQSFESEEAAKELTIKAAKKKAEDEAKLPAKVLAKKSAVAKQVDTKQKTKKESAANKKQTATAPGKEDAPVARR